MQARRQVTGWPGISRPCYAACSPGRAAADAAKGDACLPLYTFSNLNHLGERFASFARDLPSDDAAIAFVNGPEPLYPIEVRQGDRRLALIRTPPWRPEPWLLAAIA